MIRHMQSPVGSPQVEGRLSTGQAASSSAALGVRHLRDPRKDTL